MAAVYMLQIFAAIFLIQSGLITCQSQEDIVRIRQGLGLDENTDYHLPEKIKAVLDQYRTESDIAPMHSLFEKFFNRPVNEIPLMKNASKKDIECVLNTRRIFQSISDYSSMQFLDSWGKIPPGVLYGDMNWLGSYQQCVRIKVPAISNTTNSFKNFGKPLTIGYCFPDTCELGVVWWMKEQVLQAIPMKPVQVAYVTCSPNERQKLTTSAKWVIALLSVIGAFVVAGTLYDFIFVQWKISKRLDVELAAVGADTTINDGDVAPLLEPKSVTREEIHQEIVSQMEKERGFLGKVLMCFSLLNNTRRLLTVKKSSGTHDSTLDAVHGIRFLSMSWVILGHTFFFPNIIGIKNMAIAADLLQRWTMQTILLATVSVDSFFVLSGVLITFLALREIKKKGGLSKFNWFLYYFHRYWRLTVPYMIILGINAALFQYMGHGPMWPPGNTVNANCHESWWTNLLYVNNLVKKDKACFGWAWYLANDMQFYWITPLFLITLFVKWWIGVPVTCLVLLGSLITTYVISFKNHFGAALPGQIVNPPAANSTASDFNDLYQAPWCRIGPYIMGVLLGYLLYITNRQIKIHKAFLALGWFIATTVACSVVFGLFSYTKGEVQLGNSITSLYNATYTTAWGLAVCWVIFVCVTGQGGFVNSLLSWSALVPLSRLTYMAYLCHPIVMMAYGFQAKYQFNYDDFSIIYLFLANLVMAYMVAFVACLLFEAPFMVLEKVVIEQITKVYQSRTRGVSGISDTL